MRKLILLVGRDVVLATVGASSDVLDPKQARDALAKIIFEHFGDVKRVLDARDEAEKTLVARSTGSQVVPGTMFMSQQNGTGPSLISSDTLTAPSTSTMELK